MKASWHRASRPSRPLWALLLLVAGMASSGIGCATVPEPKGAATVNDFLAQPQPKY